MVYCSECGFKNNDEAVFCSKCGVNLKNPLDHRKKDDDCVCEGNNRNPLVPIFWGITIILIGVFIIDQSTVKRLPFDFGGLILIIIALAIILTGFRMLSKNR